MGPFKTESFLLTHQVKLLETYLKDIFFLEDINFLSKMRTYVQAQSRISVKEMIRFTQL